MRLSGNGLALEVDDSGPPDGPPLATVIAPVGIDHTEFLGDTLAEIALLAAETVADLGLEPRVAMLSFSNFGDAPHAQSQKVAAATAIVKARRPELMVEGEKRRFWIPGPLAYGDQAQGGRPSGMLVFDVELLEIKK